MKTGITSAIRSAILLAQAFLVTLAIFLPGCAMLTHDYDHSLNDSPGMQAYEEGLRAYENGDYRKAAQLFDGLTQKGFDSGLRRKALYSLACTRMVMASNPEDFRKALETWNQWEALSQPTSRYEDPRLMAPLLLYTRPPYEPILDNVGRDPGAPQEVEPIRPMPKFPDRSKHKPMELPEQSCYKQTRPLEREINRLKNQIKALESLDQHIQERKREIAVP